MLKIRDYASLLPLRPDEMARLLAHRRIDENGCWIWTGSYNRRGYGWISFRNQKWLVHRLFFLLFNGPIPDGHVVDHLCGHPACCNPLHLDAVTSAINNRRAAHPRGVQHYLGRLTHCKRGHPLSADNVQYHIINGRPQRRCRACAAIRTAECRARKKGSSAAPQAFAAPAIDLVPPIIPFLPEGSQSLGLRLPPAPP
jgi:hypothetical protein